ncbi:hypothetical protein ABPG74_003456 [Tetrahymena malaccensis]
MSAKFQTLHGVKPDYFVRAPGRVNLIGEHIDYMNYPVFPFALEQDSLLCFTFSDDELIHIDHMNSEEFHSAVVSNDPAKRSEIIASLTPKQSYIKYFIAGYCSGIDGKVSTYKGLKVLIGGNVPLASGCSSSTSLCVSSSILGVFANKSTIEQSELLENIIKYERSLGTACGGMDQTISLLAVHGKALFIEFNEFAKIEQVQLPHGVSFVIANSLTPSAKLETLGKRYNKRVSECRMACKILMDKMSIKAEKPFTNLRQLVRNNESLEEMQEKVKTLIEQKVYTKDEIEQIIGTKLEDFLQGIPQSELVITQNNDFYPYERALHVYSEANRVYQFQKTCFDTKLTDQEKIPVLGKLMNESQYSCDNLYDCSSDKLNELISICRKNGAIGSRLTGAGWGGCTVSMVKSEDLSTFLEAVKTQYYEKNGLTCDENILFATAPANGAMVYKNLEF